MSEQVETRTPKSNTGYLTKNENHNSLCAPAWFEIGGQRSIQSNIYDAVLGPDGYIYLSSVNGLHRLEGERIRDWFPDANKDGALSAGAIIAMTADNKSLWLGSSAGLSRFFPDTQRFERIPIADRSFITPRITALQVIDNQLYIGSIDSGIFVLNVNQPNIIKQLPWKEETALNPIKKTVLSLTSFADTTVAGLRNGIAFLDTNGKFTDVVFPDPTIAPGRVNVMKIGPKGHLWAAAENGLYQFDSLEPLSFRHFTNDSYPSLPPGELEAIDFDLKGTLWVANENGLVRLNTNEDSFSSCSRVNFSDTDRNVNISFLHARLDGYLMLGTRGQRIRIAPITDEVRRLPTGDFYPSSIKRSAIWSSLTSLDNRLLIGTSKGLYREKASGIDEFEHVLPEQLGDKRVLSLHQSAEDTFWVGTNKGLYKLNNNKLTYVPLLILENGQKGREVVYRVVQQGKHLLISTAGGLVILDPESLKTKRLFHSTLGQRTPDNAPETMLDKAGFWHVSANGTDIFATGSTYIYRLNAETGEVLGSLEHAKKTGQFNPSRTFATAISDDNRIFIGTDNGLAITNKEFNQFEFINELNGNRLGGIQNLLNAPDGMMWLSSSLQGVLKHIPKTKTWYALSSEDGLHSKRASQGALSVSKDGKFISATAIGLSTGDARLLPRQLQQKLSLDALDVSEMKRILNGEIIELAPKVRDFTLELMVPEPIEGGRYKLAYTFSNSPEVDEERYINLDQPVSFQYLQSGNYSFNGHLISPSGVASDPLTFTLVVQPYWWERVSFQVLLFMAGIAAIAFIFYSRARSIEYRQSLIADERKRIAQDLHDNLLQDIIGARMIGRSIASSIDNADDKKRLQDVLALLATSSESARKCIGHLSKLSDVPAVSDMIDTSEFEQRFGSVSEVSIIETGKPWYISTYRRFFMFRILHEAVNNAYKHAEAEKITVSINWHWSHVIITVKDNGSGFDKEFASNTTGYGLGAMHRMAEAARFTLHVDSNPGGTTIRLKASRFMI